MSNRLNTTPNDLRAFWMPFTANRQFKKEPRLFVGAKDMYYTTHDGRQVLDGTAGLWCVNAGHCRPKITEAIREQAGELDYAPASSSATPRPSSLPTVWSTSRPTIWRMSSTPIPARNRSKPH